MTDRELLELAAKAAGLEMRWGRDWHNTGAPLIGALANPADWNPLTDDGDALRLAMKLRLRIDHNHPADQQHWVAADRNGCEGCYAPVSCVEDDFEDESQRSSATRRAIVRAAAAIGRAMPRRCDDARAHLAAQGLIATA